MMICFFLARVKTLLIRIIVNESTGVYAMLIYIYIYMHCVFDCIQIVLVCILRFVQLLLALLHVLNNVQVFITQSKKNETSKSKNRKTSKSKTKTARAASGYQLFCEDLRSKKTEKLTLKDTAAAWKKCTDSEKAKWNEKAEKLKERRKDLRNMIYRI